MKLHGSKLPSVLGGGKLTSRKLFVVAVLCLALILLIIFLCSNPVDAFCRKCEGIGKGRSYDEVLSLMKEYQLLRETSLSGELVYRLDEDHSADICFVQFTEQVVSRAVCAPD
ncbi:MAG: hypothetical protein PHC51_08230 [bacterium]|nr:hypothetical protein [bacterium]